jgi:NAD(P)-dependent dehydrogenase (short-subunit alcohol dehydrogenase family)
MEIRSGQVAVVTGAASGIGFGLAEAFSERGLSVVLADVRPDALKQAASTLGSSGATVHTVETDVRDAEAVDQLANATLERFGRVDIVCNNAGVVGPFAPIWEQDLATWRWILDVALMGVVHGMRTFVPHLIANGSGHVVNTASVGGLVPLPMLGPYNAAKHAVVGLSETLLAELRQAGADVGVSVVCPGLVETGLAESSEQIRPAAVPSRSTDGQAPRLAAAAGGVEVVKPSEVARAVLGAIEADQLHLVFPAGAAAGPRARVEALLADLP